MPRQRSESELEALRAKAVALDQKIREVSARNRAKRDEEDRRRWLLAGRAALEHMTEDSSFAATMTALIDQHARSAADRMLFQLAPISRQETETSPTLPMNKQHNPMEP